MLLRQVGIPFRQRPAAVDEQRRAGEPPAVYVRRMATTKARAVKSDLPILAADTTVVAGERVFGKPSDRTDFFATMRHLADSEHRVLTAVALRWRDREDIAVAQARVSLRAIDENEMAAYWETGEPADKAGGYAIQGVGALFVRELHGGYDTVVGLPLAETERLLRSFGIDSWRWRAAFPSMAEHAAAGKAGAREAKVQPSTTRPRPPPAPQAQASHPCASARTANASPAKKPPRQELLIDVTTFETRAALTADGALRDLFVERSDTPSLIGNLYLGKVLRIVPSIQAAFVDIGLPRAGFLHVRNMRRESVAPASTPTPDISALLHQEQRLLVQVVKDPIKQKGVRLSANPALTGRHLVLQPLAATVTVSRRMVDEAERTRLKALVETLRENAGESMGYIVRTAARDADAERLAADMAMLRRRWALAQQAWRDAGQGPALISADVSAPVRALRELAPLTTAAVVVNDDEAHRALADYAARHMPALASRIRRYRGAVPLFDAYDLETALERASDQRVALPSGGRLLIDETAAMTTIDVDSGSTSPTSRPEDTTLRTNLEAARAIPLELRRRNIGGIVVVDFIDMKDSAHQHQVLALLRDAAADDPAPLSVSAFSPLGLVELSRRRRRDSLASQYDAPCSCCAGSGRAKSVQTVCFEILRAVRRQQHIDDRKEYVLRAGQAVIDRLRHEDAPHLAVVSRQAACAVALQVESSYRDEFDLSPRCNR